MPKINWNDAEQQSSLVPDGKYLCRVKNVVEKTTKTGKKMWTVWLSIEEEGQYFGNILFHNLVFGETSLWMVKQFYEAAWGAVLVGEHECMPSDLKDNYVIVHVKGKREYEGKEQPVLSYFENTEKKDKPISDVTEEDAPY
jgi:hypothetical protein